MNKLIILLLILFLYSCNEEKANSINESAISMNESEIPLHVLIDSVENYGSITAFHRLETASLDFRSGEFLSTFMIMADEYNNAFACMEVYRKIINMYKYNVHRKPSENDIYTLNSLNPDARKMAIRYLIKADSLGNEEAKNHLQEYKKIGLIK